MGLALIFVFSGGACVLIGAILYSGNGLNAIAGYNTAPKEKKERYDTKKLSKYTGGLSLILGLIFIVTGAINFFYPAEWVINVGVVVFCGVCFTGVIYNNVKQPCIKEEYRKR